jgi:hypothetical protein
MKILKLGFNSVYDSIITREIFLANMENARCVDVSHSINRNLSDIEYYASTNIRDLFFSPELVCEIVGNHNIIFDIHTSQHNDFFESLVQNDMLKDHIDFIIIMCQFEDYSSFHDITNTLEKLREHEFDMDRIKIVFTESQKIYNFKNETLISYLNRKNIYFAEKNIFYIYNCKDIYLLEYLKILSKNMILLFDGNRVDRFKFFNQSCGHVFKSLQQELDN